MVRLMGSYCRRLSYSLLAATLAMAFPVHPSGPAEQPFTPQEGRLLDEYRLHCRPGRFIEEVGASLKCMQQRHPGSAFLQDTAFLSEVRYIDRGFLWDGNDRKSREWLHAGMLDTLFHAHAPSREAWSRSRRHDGLCKGFTALGVMFSVANAFLGLHSLFNPVPPGDGRSPGYRLAQVALPVGWIGSFVYAGINVGRRDRELDKAFFESNGRAIAKRLARDERTSE